jgi:hypothetical protein
MFGQKRKLIQTVTLEEVSDVVNDRSNFCSLGTNEFWFAHAQYRKGFDKWTHISPSGKLLFTNKFIGRISELKSCRPLPKQVKKSQCKVKFDTPKYSKILLDENSDVDQFLFELDFSIKYNDSVSELSSYGDFDVEKESIK